MKRLPPSIQKDQRYLRFQIRSEKQFEFSQVVKSLWSQIETDLGTLEASKGDIWIIKNKFDEEDQQGVIKVNKEVEDHLRAALTFLQEIDGESAFIEVKKTSGMIDKV